MKKSESIGDRIVSIREKLGISASEFARRVQVTPTAVWNWEKNGIVPRGHVLPSIAAALGVSEEYLKLGVGAPTLEPADVKPGSVRMTVAEAIERAKLEICRAAGLPTDRIKLTVEFI
jgi:transcriptional regulator with XRE-family HTH domain